MRLLLTGATGYLGRRLAAALAAEGHRLSALVLPGSDTSVLDGGVPETERLVIGEQEPAQVFSRGYDGIVHLAACYGRHGEPLSEVFAANCGWPLQLLEAAVAAGVPAWISAGTSLPPHLGAYALAKRQFADWGQLLAERGRITFVDLALEHFYGADDSVDKFVTRVIRQCLENVPELPLTAGVQKRDFIHVDDVVAAFVQVVRRLPELNGYRRLPVGSGAAVAIRDLVERIHRLTGSTTRLDFGAVQARAGEPEELRADPAALQALGWHCRVSLDEGLAQTIEAERRAMPIG